MTPALATTGVPRNTMSPLIVVATDFPVRPIYRSVTSFSSHALPSDDTSDDIRAADAHESSGTITAYASAEDMLSALGID